MFTFSELLSTCAYIEALARSVNPRCACVGYMYAPRLSFDFD